MKRPWRLRRSINKYIIIIINYITLFWNVTYAHVSDAFPRGCEKLF